MKKVFSLFVVFTLILNLIPTNSFAENGNLSENVPENAIESMVIDDTLWIWSEGDDAVIGSFCQDGTLSVCWIDEDENTKTIYQTFIPKVLVNNLPYTENNIVDLQYVVDNIEGLELQVSTVAVINKEEEISQDSNSPQPYSMGPNTLKENAVRQCISRVHSINTYDSAEVFTSYRYSPAVISVYETKTFVLNYGGSKGGLLKKGFDTVAAAAAIYSYWPDIPKANIASYVSAALTFISGKLPEDISLEKYTGTITYSRFAGHRGPGESAFTLCKHINEERIITCKVLIDYTEANENTTNFADITKMAGDPIITYLNSETSFSYDSIIDRAYTDYRLTH